MIFRRLLWLIIFVSIILNLVLSAYLIYEQNKIDFLCVEGSTCTSVQNSSYAYLFCIKLVYISIFVFLFLLVLFLISEILSLFAGFIGSCFAIYFIAIQIFVLKQICSTCLIIDLMTILIFIVMIIRYSIKKHKKSND